MLQTGDVVILGSKMFLCVRVTASSAKVLPVTPHQLKHTDRFDCSLPGEYWCSTCAVYPHDRGSDMYLRHVECLPLSRLKLTEEDQDVQQIAKKKRAVHSDPDILMIEDVVSAVFNHSIPLAA